MTFSRASCFVIFAALLSAACAPRSVARSASFNTVPVSNTRASDDAILIDTELSAEGCTSVETGVGGFARMEVRTADGAGELEYELSIENPARLRLAQAVMVLHGTASQATNLVLWNGEPSDKQRIRMRGIMRLPQGVTQPQVAAALRERRSALRLQIADENGAPAGCGELRN